MRQSIRLIRGEGEEQYPDNEDGTNPLDPKEDDANTPVYKVEEPPVEPEEPPTLSYTMEKNRVTEAKLKPGTEDKYGFEKGDTVEYEVKITNTGECDLTMDVTDSFADADKFTDLRVTNVDGAVKNSDLTDRVGVNITIKAGGAATVTFTAIVATDIELLSDSAVDDGKGYENTAKTDNVKGTYTLPRRIM